MRDIFNYIKQLPSAYWGSYAYQGFFYVSLIIILILEKDKIKKHLYATYALILLLIVMNPITIQISKLFFGEGGVAEYYPRMFAMMPLICIIAYAFVLLVDKTTGLRKLCLVAIMSAMVVMGGNCIYTEAWMQKADNQAKMPDAVVEICSYVHSDEDIVKIAVPSDIVCYIRQWDASLLMPYGRYMNEWGKLLDGEIPAAKKVLAEAANVDCDYIVTHRTDAWWSDFYALGYEPEYIMDDYMIYHVGGVEGYRYTYNDLMQISRTTRVSASGQPIATSSGYCSISYEYDLKGRKLREMYFDTEDEPYAVLGGYYGISYSYNRKNLVAELTYLDKEGNPVQSAEGYAGICYSYNSDNKNIYEWYVDKEGNSVATIGGYYGIKRSYDDKGYVSSLTYVDDNGDAVIYGSYGVATIIYEYNDAGQNMYERYFDQNGIPIAKANGAYGTKMEYNPDGRVRQYTYVDEKGTSIIISNGYSSITYEYDEKGRNIDERYFDIDGSPIALSYGQYGMKREYNEDGLVSKLAYTDAEGNPMLASTGYAEISYEYNDLKQVIKENYFDIDGNPIAVSNGSYGVLKEYDEVGFISRCTYIDAEGNPIVISTGYSMIETDRNEKGQNIYERYFDTDGNTLVLGGTFSGKKFEYDEAGNIVSITTVDADGKPVNTSSGYATQEIDWNSDKQNIYERYFDEQGAPFKTAAGYCGVKREYTDTGKVSRLTYVDDSGDAVNITDGYATITYEYNDAGEEISRCYYDEDGKELEMDSLLRERISSGYKDDYWVLTNYKDASENQGMFYSLHNPDTGKLILVDSGWAQNAEQVRAVIEELGGHVDAWFLTHYDNDHIDAFNVVYSNLGDITIDDIYVTPLDYDYYMTTLRDWDTPESFTRFRELTAEADNVHALARGDEFELEGLQVKVFNVYDDAYMAASEGADLPNTASLVFKISGEEDSVLFCGDCHGEAMADFLLEEWGDVLEAEYVQLGHHGHNSFPAYFYDAVSPKVALFDAPGWLVNGEQYNAKALKEELIGKAVKCFDFASDNKHSFWFK